MLFLCLEGTKVINHNLKQILSNSYYVSLGAFHSISKLAALCTSEYDINIVTSGLCPAAMSNNFMSNCQFFHKICAIFKS